MRKPNDSIQQFTALRTALLSERDVLQKRLHQINAALGAAPASASPAPSAPAGLPARAKRGRPPGPSGPRPGNSLSIREAVAKVTAKKPLSIRDIVDAVQKIGYKFQSSNPVNSLGAYLYGSQGKKHFTRKDGKFSVV